MDRAVRFLLIEDNPGDSRLLCAMLADPSAGGQLFEPTTVTTLADAKLALKEQPFDVVLLDLSLPDSTGLDTLRNLLAVAACPAIVVLTGLDDVSLGIEAVRLGAQDYLVKGRTDRTLLVRAMSYAIQRKDLVTQLQKARDLLEMRVESRTRELRQAVEVLQEEVSARLEAEQQLRRTNQALTMVTECDKALVRADDEISLLNETCRIIAQIGRYRLVFASAALKDEARTLVPVAVAGVELKTLQDLPLSYDPASLGGRGPTGRAVWLGQPVACNNIMHEGWTEAWQSMARRLEVNSGLAVPLRIGDDVLGTLTLYDHRIDAFGDDETALIAELADDLAFGMSALRTRQKRRQAEQELQHSNALLERVFSNTHTLMAYLDRNFNFIRVNRRFAEHAGRDEEYFTGKNHFELHPHAENQQIFAEAVRTGQVQNVYENPFFYPDTTGGMTWWNWSVVPVHALGGEVEGVVVSLLDVTDHVHSRNALRDSERKAQEARLQLGTIVESSEDAIFSVTRDGTVTSWNRGAQLIWGYRASNIIGRSIARLMPQERIGDLKELLDVVLGGRRARNSDLVGKGKSGRKIHVGISVSAMRDVDSNVIGASLVARDITIRKRMENEVLQIVDAERQRARYELHEQVAQRLSGTAMLCSALARKLEHAKGSNGFLVEVANIEKELRLAIRQTTSLAHGLVPVAPTPHGLMDSLRELCGQTEQVHPSPACRFSCDRPVSIRNAATANQLYRVAQEAVSNAVGLGRATMIHVDLARKGGMVHLTITDNGTGGHSMGAKKARDKDAGPKVAKEAKSTRTGLKSRTLGLQVMSYRASSIGGSLTLRRGPKGGTIVRVSAPVLNSRSPRPSRGTQ